MAKTTPRRNVTFELTPAMLTALQEDAHVHGSASHHQRAREIVVDFLANREASDLRATVSEIDSNVAYLGELVRRVAFSVIVHAGKKSTKDANEWIRDHMPRAPRQ